MTDTPEAPTDATMQSTIVTFQIATLAEQRGAPLSFFQQLGEFYNALHDTNDYDLDIGIYHDGHEPSIHYRIGFKSGMGFPALYDKQYDDADEAKAVATAMGPRHYIFRITREEIR